MGMTDLEKQGLEKQLTKQTKSGWADFKKNKKH
jgi:hypothetical protein